MKRRAVLTTAAGLAVAGCSGGGDEPSSEGDDDTPIERPAEELLPTAADFGGDGWERREADDEQCRRFVRDANRGRTFLVACAWVYEDVATAETEYDTQVEYSSKLTGPLRDEEPDVGSEAAVAQDGVEVDVVFRDANAVGRLEYERDVGRVHGDEIDEFGDDAVEYAVEMHRQWRE